MMSDTHTFRCYLSFGGSTVALTLGVWVRNLLQFGHVFRQIFFLILETLQGHNRFTKAELSPPQPWLLGISVSVTSLVPVMKHLSASLSPRLFSDLPFHQK